jgi:hypothetical protein
MLTADMLYQINNWVRREDLLALQQLDFHYNMVAVRRQRIRVLYAANDLT